jgi:hypothetical protein
LRLTALSRLLDVTKGRSRSASQIVKSLCDNLELQPDLVVECFAKLTEAALIQQHFYIQADKAKPILKRGLSSENPKTAAAAKQAIDNLLRAGRSEFLDLSDA